MGMTLTVARSMIDTMLSGAALAAPDEACGILFGTPARIETALATRNIHPTPRTHFEIDPATLIAAHKAERVGGPGIAGYWHSHPTGSLALSPTDRANASGDGKVWAIVAGGEVSFWRDGADRFEPLPTCVVDG